MDPVMLVLIPGFLGGLIVALVMFRMPASRSSLDPLRDLPRTTDPINMARIRVEGVGGLGLVAMALTVAWFVPRIRQHVAVGLALGVLLAVLLILVRRRRGPMTSSGGTPGANATLSIDVPTPPRDEDGRGIPPASAQNVT
jgi:hypothetical protein